MVSEPLVNVIGAGIAGMSAAIRLAEAGYRCNLVSLQASERAQSVLAEGGINAALDTMGEGDEVKNHIEDTLKGGCYLASERAVENLCRNAPDTVRRLQALGVPFNTVGGKIQLRNFGGQKKKRTAFSKTATGKMICSALIDEVRKYEARGLIERYSHHELYSLRLSEGACVGCVVVDVYASSVLTLDGPVILALGGLNGFFEGETTGTVQNTGDAAARLFGQGLPFADLEFIQYHPTTARITGKRMLISEAARGEGGRLFFYKDGHKYYYMEEKYPVLKNLMPRDVVSRETYAVLSSGNKAYLDMTEIKDDVWATKLSDLREEIRSYLHLDPKKVPVEVSPGI
ncbi:MAG: FAD-binding protein, partial [Clostridia bacterium]|nr:FAD-binding protein [Clostridia bacterium]